MTYASFLTLFNIFRRAISRCS